MTRELLMTNSFAWTDAEGRLITVDKALRCNARNLLVEGQTYQNLVTKNTKVSNFPYNEETGEYTLTNPSDGSWNDLIIQYSRPIVQNEKLLIRVNFIKNTIVTAQNEPIKITFCNESKNDTGYVNPPSQYTGIFEFYCDGANIDESINGRFKLSTRTYQSGELVIKDIQVIPVLSNPLGSTELPTSINGIESVAERESKNLLENVKWHDGMINNDNGQHLDSDVAMYSDLIDIDINTLYYTNLIDNNGNTYRCRLYKADGSYLGQGLTATSTKDMYDRRANLKGLAKIRLLILNKTVTPLPSNPILLPNLYTEADIYPVQIAQSHNETDGIVLPNGVTNTIENGVHVKRIGKIVLDETLGYKTGGWGNQVETIGFEVEITTSAPYYFLKPVISSCFKYDRNFELDIENIQHVRLANGGIEFIRFRILRSKLETQDVAGVKLWLKDNPIIVWYELETPITEPCVVTEVNMPIPLRSLPSGIKDTIEGNKVIQRIGKIVATSTSIPWASSLYSVGDDTRMTYVAHGSLNDIKHISGVNNDLICDKLPVGNLTAENSNYNIMVYGHSATNKELRIAVPKTLLPNGTVKEFKEWLDANPVTIYYELATPIEHTIEQPIISIAKGSNLISTSNNIQPNLKLTYKKSTRKNQHQNHLQAILNIYIT